MKKWQAEAPSNIALIKYMGKISSETNQPTNSSISLTLSQLKTFVEIEETASGKDTWEALKGEQYHPIQLGEKAQTRYLDFFSRLKDEFSIRGNFIVRSASNFPADCGIASSASSFAALTQVSYDCGRDSGCKELDLNQLSQVSRQGSGSSCRSFFAPWGLWTTEGECKSVDLPYNSENLLHHVAIVSDEKKTVSSSEAHLRVTSSELFLGRPERAHRRLEALMSSLQSENWESAYQICWQEFWDMHALFETSHPHFGYMNAGSIEAIQLGKSQWDNEGRGPIITMDAGPNVHFIYRKQDQDLFDGLKKSLK